MDGFAAGEERWIERLGNLRNLVRQKLISRQLAEHVDSGASVLDVGCGQGTQAIRLAQRGCSVTGLDPSRDLLSRLRTGADQAGVSIEVVEGELGDIARLLGARVFDAVCAHGLLMYLDDADEALGLLAERVKPGGVLSVTFRNRDGLAFRPGMRRNWQAAIAAFDTDSYINELGVQARAHTLDDIAQTVSQLGLSVDTWYGVRLFTDTAESDEPTPQDDLELLLQAEWLAGQRDPYRRLASQIHLVARRN